MSPSLYKELPALAQLYLHMYPQDEHKWYSYPQLVPESHDSHPLHGTRSCIPDCPAVVIAGLHNQLAWRPNPPTCVPAAVIAQLQ